MDLLEINKKLIGPIASVGETINANETFENLKRMCTLVEQLLCEIDNKSCSNTFSKDASIRRHSAYGIEFLNRIGFRNDHNKNIK